jgi:hypothetical protein
LFRPLRFRRLACAADIIFPMCIGGNIGKVRTLSNGAKRTVTASVSLCLDTAATEFDRGSAEAKNASIDA